MPGVGGSPDVERSEDCKPRAYILCAAKLGLERSYARRSSGGYRKGGGRPGMVRLTAGSLMRPHAETPIRLTAGFLWGRYCEVSHGSAQVVQFPDEDGCIRGGRSEQQTWPVLRSGTSSHGPWCTCACVRRRSVEPLIFVLLSTQLAGEPGESTYEGTCTYVVHSLIGAKRVSLL